MIKISLEKQLFHQPCNMASQIGLNNRFTKLQPGKSRHTREDNIDKDLKE
jgi:hypothetical protein